MMRAILVDAKAREIREVDYRGDLEHAYELIGCELIDVVGLDHENCMYVDDEGLFKGMDDDDHPFIVLPCGQILAGSGLIVGEPDDDGNVTPATLSVDRARDGIAFLSRRQVRAVLASGRIGPRKFFD
jgi:hypothetical protein